MTNARDMKRNGRLGAPNAWQRSFNWLLAVSLGLVAMLPLNATASIHDEWVEIRNCAGLKAFELRHKQKHAYTQSLPDKRKRLCPQPKRPEPKPEPPAPPQKSGTRSSADRLAPVLLQPEPRWRLLGQQADAAVRRGDFILARKLLQDACTEGGANACNDAGLSYSNAKPEDYGVPNPAASRPYFERACELQNLSYYCNNARIASSFSSYGPVIPQKIRYYFMRSGLLAQSIECSKITTGSDCLILADSLLDSTLGPPQHADARTLLISACKVGNGEACNRVGLSYDGTLPATYGPANFREAIRYYIQGCDLKYATACQNIAVLHTLPSVGLIDLASARTYWDKSNTPTAQFKCAVAEACRNLGLAYSLPKYGTPMPYKAFDLNNRACAAGSMLGCAELGRMYQIGSGVSKNLSLAASSYVRACDGGVPTACASAAAIYGWSAFPAYNPARAEGLQRKACTWGVQSSCSR